MNKKIFPYDDRVVIQKIEESDRTSTGIILPSIDKEGATSLGKILAIGPGRFDVNGKRMPMWSKVGDIVIYSQFGAHVIHIDDEEFIVAKEMDLVSRIEDNANISEGTL